MSVSSPPVSLVFSLNLSFLLLLLVVYLFFLLIPTHQFHFQAWVLTTPPPDLFSLVIFIFWFVCDDSDELSVGRRCFCLGCDVWKEVPFSCETRTRFLAVNTRLKPDFSSRKPGNHLFFPRLFISFYFYPYPWYHYHYHCRWTAHVTTTVKVWIGRKWRKREEKSVNKREKRREK